MNRRDLIMAGAAAAAAQGLFSAAGCKAEGSTTAASVAASPLAGDLADALGPCIDAGEVCLTHCIQRLSEGDTSLGACAVRVREMLAVCEAVRTLALSGSTHLPQAAALCADVCETCAAECAKHASHHAECKACKLACERVIAAARGVADR